MSYRFLNGGDILALYRGASPDSLLKWVRVSDLLIIFAFLGAGWLSFPMELQAAEASFDSVQAQLSTTGYLLAPSGSNTSTSEDQKSLYPSFSVEGKGHFESKTFTGVLDGEGLVTLDLPSLYYISIEEAYVSAAKEILPVEVAFGRKLESWSRLDDQWQLGVWQPRFRWDFIRPKTDGLTGLFVRYERPKVEAVVFGSPFFVPEMGPSFELENGQFHSQHPFFSAPERVVMPGTSMNAGIRYQLNKPTLKDILFHSSAGVSVRVGELSKIWSKMGYAYKPINQFRMGYDAHFQILGEFENVEERISVSLTPRVAYHHVASLEVGFGDHGKLPLRGGLAFLMEKPVEKDLATGMTTQQVTAPAQLISPSVELDLFGTDEAKTQLRLSYLHIFGGETHDVGKFQRRSQNSIFESRYAFKDAVKFGFNTPFPSLLGKWMNKIYALGNFTYDWSTEVSMLSAGLKYQVDRGWMIHVGADLLGVGPKNEGSSTHGGDWVSKFKSRDRFYGGLSYVF